MLWWRNKRKHKSRLDPEDVLLDAHNLPRFNEHQFEGRMADRISHMRGYGLFAFLLLVLVVFSGRLWLIQVAQGDEFARQSAQNRLEHRTLFADRGVLYDRHGTRLAWNISTEGDFSRRAYIEKDGFSHTLGYVSYPKKDDKGVYYDTNFSGVSGSEEAFDEILGGTDGVQIVEKDALLETVSANTITPPVDGENVTLSIDTRVQSALFDNIESIAQRVGFRGGAGIIMDVHTGEIIAMTSYPEYSSQVVTDGEDSEAIASYQESDTTPFLNRATQGLYTPGSIVKPYVALAALNEDIIQPQDNIRSTGEIRVENPYIEGEYSVFTDWKAHGLVNVVDALAVSSNVYFYVIGGGHKDQEGLGIKRMSTYLESFQLGEESDFILGESAGVVPDPSWKASVFDGEPWRLGDTYHTAIGQYGFQVTPLQMLRAVTAIAREGELVTPRLIKTDRPARTQDVSIDIDYDAYTWVKRGMREAVLRGTARGVNVSYTDIAAKTGTAEVGTSKEHVNSWITGYFPYKDPQYAFVVVMEHGHRSNLVGATAVARATFDWMREHTPSYFGFPEPKKEENIEK